MYYSKYGKQVSKGALAESTFKKTAISRGWYCHETKPTDNKYRHIDFVIYNMKSKNYYTVDVKCVGKFGYTSELTNNFNKKGSLYGEADFIAYVSSNEILLVNRKELVKLVESKINTTKPIKRTGTPKKYVKYTRPQWDDVWTLLDKEDILNLNHKIWEINND